MINAKLNTNDKRRITNQSLVFETFGEDEKLTVQDVTDRINDKAKAIGDPSARVSERTVRRAIEGLVKSGLLRKFERSVNAQTYGKLSAAMTADAKAKLIPFAGELVEVADFLRLMVDPKVRPFTLKVPLLSEEAQLALRRTMAFTIITAESTGYDEQLKKMAVRLHNSIKEAEYVLQSLKTFTESAVWYPTYRDRIGYAMRELQKTDPELHKLALDFVRS